MNDELLDSDDWVGAFNGDICVGSMNYNSGEIGGGVTTVPVMGDDGWDWTDGYMEDGQFPSFKIFKASEGMYYDAIPTEKFSFSNFDQNIINLLYEGDQVIPLSIGWNMISFNVEPEEINLLDGSGDFGILSDISDNLVKVINEEGALIELLTFLDPPQWYNGIGELGNTEGYYLRVNASDDLNVIGVPLTNSLEIPLSIGWNMISYPFQNAQNAIDVLEALIDEDQCDCLVKVINASKTSIAF
jgi:hypothetical protein